MPRRSRLGPQLMSPAGLGPEPQPGAIVRRAIQAASKRTLVIASRAPRACGRAVLTIPLASACVSQSVQVSSPVFWPAFLGLDSTIAQYSLTTRPPLELGGEPAGGLGRLGPDQEARRRPVEPVDDPQIDRAGIGRIEVLPDRCFQRDLIGRRPRSLGELAGRLDDGQAMRIFVENDDHVVSCHVVRCPLSVVR